MSASAPSFRKDMAKIFLYPLLSLFLIPAGAAIFVHQAMPEIDRQIIAQLDEDIARDTSLSRAEAEEQKAFIREVPPSRVCGSSNPKLAGYRQAVCSSDLDLWQFYVVSRVAFWLMVGGAAALGAALALGALAFVNRRAQYLSFVLGWRLLSTLAAIGVAAQGALLVWLSYWVTVFYDQAYYPKLIIAAGILVALGVFLAVAGLFKRPSRTMAVEGEQVSEADAPQLWAHVRACAERLGTRAPDHIIAGIDANFFVTEAPVAMGDAVLQGRSLYISIPLLRLLERTEADAVLAHELAHFSGGDTASSARLYPRLHQYDAYCAGLRSGVVTLVVYHLMRLYRVIFEFALKREARAREFQADRAAAALASGQAIVHSLVKVAAYAQYRSETENRLFEHDEQHGESLGIARRIGAGLRDYALSPRFIEEMRSANVPHPFDTHPSLQERMASVGLRVDEQDYGSIAAAAPAGSWADDIRTAAEIEQRLWAAYEESFAAEHERALAYRYEPATEAEAAIVLKHFPPLSFPLKRGKRLELSYAGLTLPGTGELLPWDRVHKLGYKDGYLADVMEITHPEKGVIGRKSTKARLAGAGKQRNAIKQALNAYWGRHLYMRKHQAAG